MANEGQQQQQQQTDANKGGQQQQQQIAQRPDYIPEKFWNPEKGEPRLEDWGKAHRSLETQLHQGKTAFEAERLAQRPTTPEGYALTGVKYEGLPQDLVFHDSKPADLTKLDQTKRHFVLDDKHPMLAAWRTLAHENGLPPAMFQKGVVAFADFMTQHDAPPTADQIEAERKVEYAKLGEQGVARVDHAWKQLKSAVGDEYAGALDDVLGSAKAIEAIEALLAKAGAPKFGGTGGAAGGVTVGSIDDQIARLKADPEFSKAFLDHRHPMHRQRVQEMTELQAKRANIAA